MAHCLVNRLTVISIASIFHLAFAANPSDECPGSHSIGGSYDNPKSIEIGRSDVATNEVNIDKKTAARVPNLSAPLPLLDFQSSVFEHLNYLPK